MPEHCLEYETLTMEERILLDKKMSEWFANTGIRCMTITGMWDVERKIIKKIRKENNDRRNRKQGAGRRNNK